MHIYIMGDLEGAAGVVDFVSQSYSDGKYNEQAKRLATFEVNAMVEGLNADGVAEILFVDGHGSGGVDIELLHPSLKVMLGRPISAPWGLDGGIDAMMLYGHHARANTERAVLCHSWSSRAIDNCWLNGELVGEIGFNMALAGQFDIPTIFISGDDATIAEARNYVPNIEGVSVKQGLSRTSAITLTPIRAREKIRDGVREAVRRIGEIEPLRIPPPYEFRVRYLEDRFAESKAQQPGVERLDERTCRLFADDLVDLARRR